MGTAPIDRVSMLFTSHLVPVWRAAEALPEPVTAAAVESLRALVPGEDPAVIGMILEQARLRRRAASRIGPRTRDMLFTDVGLQQASRVVVAKRRAKHLAAMGVAGIADLGCGIGMDSLAFLDAGLRVTAVEGDPFTAALAIHNLDRRATVRCTDLRDVDLQSFPAVFLDPARRMDGRRLMDPEQWQPPWSWVRAAADAQPATVAKAAPGIAHELLPADAAVEHVSVDHVLTETTVWFPGLRADAPRRRAVAILTRHEAAWRVREIRELGSDAPRHEAEAGALQDWLVEPDAAVIRSGLVAELADRIHGHLTSTRIAYLTCPHDPGPTLGRRFAVREVLPMRTAPLRRALRERRIGAVEIRTRGLNLDPDAFRRTLRLQGDRPAQLVLTRLQGRPAALLVDEASD